MSNETKSNDQMAYLMFKRPDCFLLGRIEKNMMRSGHGRRK